MPGQQIQQLRQARIEPALGQFAVDIQGQPLRHATVLHRRQRPVDLCQAVGQHAGEELPGVGQVAAAAFAHEQRLADEVFQGADLLADGAVGEVEFARGTGETAATGRLDERTHGLHRRVSLVHAVSPTYTGWQKSSLARFSQGSQ
ncbi:hypothetical protein D3C76_1057090 [compost metagenome]